VPLKAWLDADSDKQQTRLAKEACAAAKEAKKRISLSPVGTGGGLESGHRLAGMAEPVGNGV
jgi:hypothetical protein